MDMDEDGAEMKVWRAEVMGSRSLMGDCGSFVGRGRRRRGSRGDASKMVLGRTMIGYIPLDGFLPIGLASGLYCQVNVSYIESKPGYAHLDQNSTPGDKPHPVTRHSYH